MTQQLITPARLQAGDTVAVFAPAFQVDSEKLRFTIERLEALGLNVIDVVTPLTPDTYFAGNAQQVITSIHNLFVDKSIKALFAVRGGFGCARLLSLLDYDLIKANPKIIIGYSDLTALLIAIHEKTGLITYHGPTAAQELPPFSQHYLYSTLFTDEKICYQNTVSSSHNDLIQTQHRHITLIPGKAQGHLMGGNLAVLTSIIGSEFFPHTWNDKILFVEDVHENIYKIDRMFTQLKLAGVLKQIKGLVLGTFIDCNATVFQSPTFMQLMKRIADDINVPCYANASFGHQIENFTLPIGAEILLNADQGNLTLI